MTGVARGHHSSGPFHVSAKELGDPIAKRQGLLECVAEYIGMIESDVEYRGRKEDERDELTARLRQLTGEDRETATGWREWLNQNRDWLAWSESKRRFLIDEDAKKAGVPTVDYRRSHGWPEGPPG